MFGRQAFLVGFFRSLFGRRTVQLQGVNSPNLSRNNWFAPQNPIGSPASTLAIWSSPQEVSAPQQTPCQWWVTWGDQTVALIQTRYPKKRWDMLYSIPTFYLILSNHILLVSKNKHPNLTKHIIIFKAKHLSKFPGKVHLKLGVCHPRLVALPADSVGVFFNGQKRSTNLCRVPWPTQLPDWPLKSWLEVQRIGRFEGCKI